MTEYINKAELKKQLKEETANEYPPFNLVTSYIKVVENMPTIDIIHCEECKHYIPDDEEENFGECFSLRDIVRGDDATTVYVDGDFFCKFGERKE